MECPVCGQRDCIGNRDVQRNMIYVECTNCGVFEIGGLALRVIRENEAIRGVVSHEIWRNQNQEQNKYPTILKESVEMLLKEYPHGFSIPEQLDNYVLYLGDRDAHGFVHKDFKPFAELRAKIGTADTDDVASLCGLLRDDELVTGSPNLHNAKLTIKGWNRYRELKEGQVSVKAVFMAMPFSDVRVQYEGGESKTIEIPPIYQAFQKAADEAGFVLSNPLKELEKAGDITDRLMVEIRRSRFLVADLTGHNCGAYWEAGFAEGLGKKVIYSCEREYFEKKKTHFDCCTRNTILWEPDNLELAAEQLTAVIRNTFFTEARQRED